MAYDWKILLPAWDAYVHVILSDGEEDFVRVVVVTHKNIDGHREIHQVQFTRKQYVTVDRNSSTR